MSQSSRSASAAHERVMMNLAFFHLVLPVAAFSSGHIAILLTIALIGSILMIITVAVAAFRPRGKPELVQAHQRLAWKRTKLLLFSYLAAAVIMLMGWLISVMQTDTNMKMIELIVFGRLAVVPILLMVLVIFVLEMSALSEARQGQLPK